jgi:diguanylate cyclase (GGDEF)-like protein
VTYQPIAPLAAEQGASSDASQRKAPTSWVEAQASLAATADLSLLLVDGPQPPAQVVSNNNSICQSFQSSPEHAHLCAPYCGKAYERAQSAGTMAHYRCHAGLHCVAVPVNLSDEKQRAVIGGRAFLTSADYRALAERVRAGDLQDLLSSDLFKNVIFAAQQDLEELGTHILELARRFNQRIKKEEADHAAQEETPTRQSSAVNGVVPHAERKYPSLTIVNSSSLNGSATAAAASAAIHSVTLQKTFLSDASLEKAYRAVLLPLTEKHQLEEIALLLRDKDTLKPVFATGRFRSRPTQVHTKVKDVSLFTLMAETATSLTLREDARGFQLIEHVPEQRQRSKKSGELFPLLVGDDVTGALIIGDARLTEEKRSLIAAFCHDISLPLEVLRLCGELEQRARLNDDLQNFATRVNSFEPSETYLAILRHSAEMLHAERGSLLLFDEQLNELTIKAAVGLRAEVAATTRIRLGEGVAGTALKEERPLVVRDIEALGHTPAPAERRYKTKSFISYPITLGGRKVGVLNITDKTGGGVYDEFDLKLLEIIAPQLALALDRAGWHEKALRFQMMSITDPLTGLYNRRYLIDRLTEELERSKRHDFPLSFIMLDIDDFKLYNDRNGHQAGDLALETTARSLKAALRLVDVPARYGGEEFCVLLPQTSLSEAKIIAERIRRRIERIQFSYNKEHPLAAVTISIGISTLSSALDTPMKIIGAADRALYLAKRNGKNRVQSYDDDISKI